MKVSPNPVQKNLQVRVANFDRALDPTQMEMSLLRALRAAALARGTRAMSAVVDHVIEKVAVVIPGAELEQAVAVNQEVAVEPEDAAPKAVAMLHAAELEQAVVNPGAAVNLEVHVPKAVAILAVEPKQAAVNPEVEALKAVAIPVVAPEQAAAVTPEVPVPKAVVIHAAELEQAVVNPGAAANLEVPVPKAVAILALEPEQVAVNPEVEALKAVAIPVAAPEQAAAVNPEVPVPKAVVIHAAELEQAVVNPEVPAPKAAVIPAVAPEQVVAVNLEVPAPKALAIRALEPDQVAVNPEVAAPKVVAIRALEPDQERERERAHPRAEAEQLVQAAKVVLVKESTDLDRVVAPAVAAPQAAVTRARVDNHQAAAAAPGVRHLALAIAQSLVRQVAQSAVHRRFSARVGRKAWICDPISSAPSTMPL